MTCGGSSFRLLGFYRFAPLEVIVGVLLVRIRLCGMLQDIYVEEP